MQRTHSRRLPIEITVFAAILWAAVYPAYGQWLPAPLLRPEIRSEIPHDIGAFTQGLIWVDGRLYESTGLYGSSTLRELDPKSGSVIRRHEMPSGFFGEGLAHFQGHLIQLTWKEGVAFRYPMKDWRRPARLEYSGEGWGLAGLGQAMWMSNGSDTLYRRNAGFKITGKMPVTLGGRPLSRLNELEGAGSRIVANVWYCDSLFIIDPHTGRALAVVDASELVARSGRRTRDDVLNGLAYDPRRKLFYVTGKSWPKMFLVRIPFDF